MTLRSQLTWFASAALLAVGCRDGSSTRPSLITDMQILALEAEPAEVAPGEHVSYRLLAVGRDGELDPRSAQLSYCRTQKQLGDNRVASDDCSDNPEAPLPELDGGARTTGVVPADACALFGPSVVAGVRAPDPDATGGYYQPVRVEFDGVVAVGLQRIRCPLPNAPIAVVQEFRERYLPNANPTLAQLSLSVAGHEVSSDHIPRGRDVRLQVGWPASSAERFVVYDRANARLIEQRESLRVSWFVTAGALQYDHTGRAADDAALVSENLWHAPDAPIHAHLWIVLRDDRGGAAYASYELSVF